MASPKWTHAHRNEQRNLNPYSNQVAPYVGIELLPRGIPNGSAFHFEVKCNHDRIPKARAMVKTKVIRQTLPKDSKPQTPKANPARYTLAPGLFLVVLSREEGNMI